MPVAGSPSPRVRIAAVRTRISIREAALAREDPAAERLSKVRLRRFMAEDQLRAAAPALGTSSVETAAEAARRSIRMPADSGYPKMTDRARLVQERSPQS